MTRKQRKTAIHTHGSAVISSGNLLVKRCGPYKYCTKRPLTMPYTKAELDRAFRK